MIKWEEEEVQQEQEEEEQQEEDKEKGEEEIGEVVMQAVAAEGCVCKLGQSVSSYSSKI